MKTNKLIVVSSTDRQRRTTLMRELLIEHKFALTNSDAAKLIRNDIYSVNLNKAYYVCVDNFKLSESQLTTQRLYELAARGIFVLLGVRSIPVKYELLCEAHY